MTDIQVFVIAVAIIFILWNMSKDPEGFRNVSRDEVCNGIDGRCYGVVDKFSDRSQQRASELLAYLNSFAIKFMRRLRKKYLWDKQGTYSDQDKVKFLLKNYNPDRIVENEPVTPNTTSYVEDKGKVFALCLRDYNKTGKAFLPKHTLEFVTLHEMAHMATRTIGHGVEFWRNFKFLLIEAKAAGLHFPVDYSKSPINYCTLHVDYNPYFDARL